MVQEFKKLLFLPLFVGVALHAGVLSVEATGEAEVDPDKYTYWINVSVACVDTEQLAADKVADLEEKVAQAVTPFLAQGEEAKQQFVSTSTSWARTYERDVIGYDNMTGDRKKTCSAGKWYDSSSSKFQLLDATKLKEVQKALSSLSKGNVSNPNFIEDLATVEIRVSAAEPGLKKETGDKLFQTVYTDATNKAKAKLKVVMNEDAKLSTYVIRLHKVEEKSDSSGRGVFLSGRSAGLEAAGAAFDAPSATAETQKLKMTANFTFIYDVEYDVSRRPL